MAEAKIQTDYVKGQLYQLNLNQLQADPNQPRKVLDSQALEELTASIQRHGVLEPVLFRQGEAGAIFCVAGERRCAAARQAGLAEIPALFVQGNDSEIALVENLLRQDLTAVEEAEALQRLMEEQKYTQDQLGAMLGKARTTINESLSLNRLPQEVRDDCRADRKLAKSTLLEIARKKQARAMVTAYNALKAKQEKGRKPREKKDPNDLQTFCDLIDKTGAKIDAIDTAAWEAVDLENVRLLLAHLREKIDSRLTALTSPAPKTAKSKKNLA